jgi:hypothetical protein
MKPFSLKSFMLLSNASAKEHINFGTFFSDF